MDLETAIEILEHDIDDPGSVDIGAVHNAEKMGIKALRLLGYEKAHRLSDESLKLLLNTERR